METVKNTNSVTRLATSSDIEDLLRLNHSWYKDNLDSLDDGFLSVTFNQDFFELAVGNQDIIVFDRNGSLLGYALVNTVMETEFVQTLRSQYLELRPTHVAMKTAYCYQIVTNLELHGTGFYQEMHPICVRHFKTKYEILVSTISKENIRSIHAHKKLGYTFMNTPHNYFIIELVL
jgi:L-amino acid N-acyltransferase YncA